MLTRPIRYAWYLALTVALAAWTWRKWPDIAVDFGHELYDPWRLSQGAVLYRDVATLYGPFSQTFNSVLFRMFGASFTTLIFANLTLLLALCAMVDSFFEFVAGKLAAFATATILLTVFGFGQYLNVGNYNFIAPYSHEATHAVILGIAMVVLLTRWVRRDELISAGAAGLCFGLVLLTKAETSVAAAFAALVAFGLVRKVWPALAMFVATAAVPIALTFILFTRSMSASDALKAVFGTFTSLRAAATSTVFYRRSMGLDDIPTNVFAMAASLVAILLIFTLAGRFDLVWAKWTGARRIAMLALLATLIGCAVILLLGSNIGVERALPLVAGVSLVVEARSVWHNRRNPVADGSFGLAVWSAFSLALLGRIALKAQVSHFGFVLALPAMLLLVNEIVCIPTEDRGRPVGWMLKSVGLAFLALFAVIHLGLTWQMDSPKNYAIGPVGDQVVALDPTKSDETRAFELALNRIETLVPPDGTVAALPQGVMLNYWSRRRNPTPYINIMPTELAAFGEETILNAYRKSPPDMILLVHSRPGEFDLRPFGYDEHYGAKIMEWIRSAYDPKETLVADPTSTQKFGIQVLLRRR